MVDGQRLCGKVRFEVSGSLGDVRLCYCELCRRAYEPVEHYDQNMSQA
jgi:hypothetical protein